MGGLAGRNQLKAAMVDMAGWGREAWVLRLFRFGSEGGKQADFCCLCEKARDAAKNPFDIWTILQESPYNQELFPCLDLFWQRAKKKISACFGSYKCQPVSSATTRRHKLVE